MDVLLKVMPIILYILLSILLIVLIVLMVKAIKTLDKVDKTIEDVNNKMGKLNGVFSLVDKGADAVNMLTDRIVGTIATGITSFFKKKSKDEENSDE
ncbi:MAG: hypothetical protein E7165_01830 [Firmicutes bacterium]|nr:hypothetical protein [Bacillota bacterium]